MSFEGRIRPFQFDRDFTGTLSPSSFSTGALQRELEELKQRLATQDAEMDVRLAAAREDGFAAGLAHARADQQMALLAALDALQAAVEAADADLSTLKDALLEGAGEVAIAAAEQLAATTVEQAPAAAVLAAIGRAADEAGLDARLRIQLNPADAPTVEASASRWALQAITLDILPDPEIPSGDARISWGASTLTIDRADRRRRVETAVAEAIAASRAQP